MTPTLIYSPIIKGKMNDLKALGKIPRNFGPRLSPVVELLAPDLEKSETLEDSMGRFSHQLKKYCPLQTISVDLHSIKPNARLRDGSLAFESLCATLRGLGVMFIPVFGFDHEPELWNRIVKIVHREGRGITFRLKIEDIDTAEETIEEIIDRLRSADIPAASTNILIDLESVFERTGIQLVEVRSQCQDFIEAALSAAKFRLITIAASSMPRDVSAVPKSGELDFPRHELQLWANTFVSMPSVAVGFGDYGIVHPRFSDKIIATNANAKIRYTTRGSHRIFRGYSLREGMKYQQYFDLTERVIQSDVYIDRNYSFGDDRIWLCANKFSTCGNLGTWVEADMNHHFVFVTAQLVRAEALLIDGVGAAEAIAVSISV